MLTNYLDPIRTEAHTGYLQEQTRATAYSWTTEDWIFIDRLKPVYLDIADHNRDVVTRFGRTSSSVRHVSFKQGRHVATLHMNINITLTLQRTILYLYYCI